MKRAGNASAQAPAERARGLPKIVHYKQTTTATSGGTVAI